ncbi:MAG: flagellar biosynthesis protein FlgI, partial [Betaproteobacteria bacterium]|nr:flagellar biosynthesis protein FlgI [Betaproteobacteria bacterium]
MKSALLLATLLCALLPAAWADRVKDLTTVASVRSNQLVGYGIVVGLANTGDGADGLLTGQSIKAMLNRLGVTLEGPISDFVTAVQSGKLDVRNAAAVMVTAELPGFAKPGQRIDVNVSAMGRAASLRGGN